MESSEVMRYGASLQPAAPPAYRHQQLDSDRSFRLVTLSSSNSPDDAITCSIKTHHLGDGSLPQYAALSYTWGTSRRDVPILVNGDEMLITRNLFEALTHLREIQKQRDDLNGVWWIDMICINQHDTPERNQQVAIMRHIFTSARLVVAWVGPEAEGSRSLQELTQPDTRREGDTNLLSWVRTFLTRLYWSRLWVIQEICVAKDVIIACGLHTIPWSLLEAELCDRTGCCSERGNIFGNFVSTLSISNFQLLIPYSLVDLKKRFTQKGVSLASLLTLTSQCQCENPRDRIYAIRGLAGERAAKVIALDYSLSSCVVYCSAIRAMIETSGNGLRGKQGKKLREILARCKHDPLNKDDTKRRKCEGMDCEAWWCCLDVALWVS